MKETAFVLAALACGLAGAADSDRPLRAGVSATDITPLEGMWPISIVGGFEDVKATSTHDPLSARALVFDDGQTRLAIVVIDNCQIPRVILDSAKQAASQVTGIPVNRMLMAATHTHSAPGSTNSVYTSHLTAQVVKAVVQAAAALQPAEAGWAVSVVPDQLFNRRWYMRPGSIRPNPYGETTDRVKMNPNSNSPDIIRPAGPVDPDLTILSVRTAAGKPLALLANYGLHYVGYVPEGQVSADYFGEFRRQIEQRLAAEGADPAFVAILSNGTSGDVINRNWQSPDARRSPFEKIRLVAGRVADAAFDAYKRVQYEGSADLVMAEREIALGTRKPTAAQLEFAQKVLAAKDDAQLPEQARNYARRLAGLKDGPDQVRVKLQALRIGSLGITAIPFEVFAEIGLEIKRRSPLVPTFNMSLANGSEGYLPTPQQHALGGYETWLGTNRVETNASIKVTDTVLELLREVSAQK
jgi:neutral ceramidase